MRKEVLDGSAANLIGGEAAAEATVADFRAVFNDP
jgi:hypothetical protein